MCCQVFIAAPVTLGITITFQAWFLHYPKVPKPWIWAHVHVHTLMFLGQLLHCPTVTLYRFSMAEQMKVGVFLNHDTVLLRGGFLLLLQRNISNTIRIHCKNNVSWTWKIKFNWNQPEITTINSYFN